MRTLCAVLCLVTSGCATNYDRWVPKPTTARMPADDADPDAADRLTTLGEWFGKSLDARGPRRTFERLRIRGVAGSKPPRENVARRNADNLRFCFSEEWDAIRETGGDRDPRVGLALSGGGIRSASFAQGILTALHELELLDRVGYLSTVSGGGYTAAWYMTHRENDAELLRPGSPHLDHLAQSGSYLDLAGSASTMGPLVQASGTTALWMPLHVVFNDVFDAKYDFPNARLLYRNGIESAFLYDMPGRLHPSDRSTWTMAHVGPVGKTKDRKLLVTEEGVPEASRPLWIVNCHLAQADDVSRRQRNGDAFELTPLRAGADSVGYVRMKGGDGLRVNSGVLSGILAVGDAVRLADPKPSYWMQIGYAVTASGAAVDSSSTRERTLTGGALRTLNLDLGTTIPGWADGWVKGDEGTWGESLRYCAAALAPFGTARYVSERHEESPDGAKYRLTDGAHFENTGAYALVRRGCRLIVISDAGYDAFLDRWNSGAVNDRARAFDDFRSLEERIFADFGAVVRVHWDAYDPTGNRTPQPPAAGAGAAASAAADPGSRLAALGDGRILVATCDNLPVAGSSGPAVFLVVKSVHPKLARLRAVRNLVDREKAIDDRFANHPTTDQFFSESRVLAYRALAHEIVMANADLLRAAVDALPALPPAAAPVPVEAPAERAPGPSAR